MLDSEPRLTTIYLFEHVLVVDWGKLSSMKTIDGNDLDEDFLKAYEKREPAGLFIPFAARLTKGTSGHLPITSRIIISECYSLHPSMGVGESR